MKYKRRIDKQQCFAVDYAEWKIMFYAMLMIFQDFLLGILYKNDYISGTSAFQRLNVTKFKEKISIEFYFYISNKRFRCQGK